MVSPHSERGALFSNVCMHTFRAIYVRLFSLPVEASPERVSDFLKATQVGSRVRAKLNTPYLPA